MSVGAAREPSTTATPAPGGEPTHPGPAPRDLGTIEGFRVWGAEGREARVRFVGRGPRVRFGEALTAITGDETLGVARMYQTHSADSQAVEVAGIAGEGDALYTRRRGLAVAVVTADCVPVLVEAGEWVAAIHAGWRGLVAGVVPKTLAKLAREEGTGDPATWRAWIGPVNGACCYEVGREVADHVAAASTPEAIVEQPADGAKPHLDLIAAARHQLAHLGVPATWLLRCTQCDADGLYSYRRNGQRAGRNHAFIWRP